jgi:hypothetical protein
VRLLVVLPLAAAFGSGCGSPEPVLTAVEPPKSVEQIAARRAAQELHASPAAMDVAYHRAPGVYVDARYFGGRSYRAVRAEVEEQLGAVTAEREASPVAREIVFERGTLRLMGDVIQMIDVNLPEPTRRSEALTMLGFPTAVGEYKALALEFRLLNVWGFRRLRFFRVKGPGKVVARDEEEIDHVQAWKFSEDDAPARAAAGPGAAPLTP